MANFKSAKLTQDTYTKVGTVEIPITGLEGMDVSNEDRLSFNFYNAGATSDVIKVYGKLGSTAGTVTLPSDMWTQIGDDITVAATSSSLKSIATTGLNFVGVTITPGTGSNTIAWAILRQA
tara:strand:+ start:26 stop:388 length:363 start_codon:yes stop_codon:yes gene_type:complete